MSSIERQRLERGWQVEGNGRHGVGSIAAVASVVAYIATN